MSDDRENKFVAWDGNGNPAPGKIVELGLVTGYFTGPRRSEDVRWADPNYQSCIVSYRVLD